MVELKTAQPKRHPNPTAKASALAHLVFERPDLQRAEDFLTDFGLSLANRTQDLVTMRGTEPRPYCYRVHRGPRARFVGAGFSVATREELERLAHVDGASGVERSPHPGGGEVVTLRDPSGFAVEVLHGQAAADRLPTREPLAFNVGHERRRINHAQRPPATPPEVIRLGHVVLEVADYQATCAWYTQHLGFIPSEVQVLPDGQPAVAFMRLDLGDTPADHHTLALAQGLVPLYSHAAYELVDTDAVGMGQRVLREKGHAHAWGIGRHILGSQVFDYWHDPRGDKHEHYCDGDVFTADQPMGVHAVSRDAMSQWGQPMPRAFTRPQFSPASIVTALRNLHRSPDLTLDKVLTPAFSVDPPSALETRGSSFGTLRDEGMRRGGRHRDVALRPPKKVAEGGPHACRTLA
jgi:catechol 2,3-dioxygenase-like lactoylglutathione lyase family enzyme